MNMNSLTTLRRPLRISTPVTNFRSPRNSIKQLRPRIDSSRNFVVCKGFRCPVVSSSVTEFSCKIRSRELIRVRAFSDDSRSSSSSGGSFGDGRELREPSALEFITSERVKVVAMLALALALCNADRVVMSVAIVPLSLSHGWRQSFAGVVQVLLHFHFFFFNLSSFLKWLVKK